MNLNSFVTLEINTGLYEIANTCAFGRILRMSTKNAASTCIEICMCVQLFASIGSQGIYFVFCKKNAANSVNLCVFGAHVSPVKCSETIFPP